MIDAHHAIAARKISETAWTTCCEVGVWSGWPGRWMAVLQARHTRSGRRRPGELGVHVRAGRQARTRARRAALSSAELAQAACTADLPDPTGSTATAPDGPGGTG